MPTLAEVVRFCDEQTRRHAWKDHPNALNGLQIDPTGTGGGVSLRSTGTVQAGVLLDIYSHLRLSGDACVVNEASSANGDRRYTPNEDAASDYLHCLERVYPLASYVTVNISSPNTAGLRELQEEQALRQLIGRLREAQERLAARHGKRVPMLVKIAPDLSDSDIEACARVLADLQVDGVIATNTTVERVAVADHPLAHEVGGLSGRPLYGRSTHVLRRMRTLMPDSIPLIGVGGILSGADAAGKIAAGASLVQVYSGLVYRGPSLIAECVNAIRWRKEGPSQGLRPA